MCVPFDTCHIVHWFCASDQSQGSWQKSPWQGPLLYHSNFQMRAKNGTLTNLLYAEAYRVFQCSVLLLVCVCVCPLSNHTWISCASFQT